MKLLKTLSLIAILSLTVMAGKGSKKSTRAAREDVEDNVLAKEDEIALDPKVGKGQIDNLKDESARDSKTESATYDISQEGAGEY